MKERNMKGSILWFNDEKGYGFIKPDIGAKDIFVHHSGISKIGTSGKLKKDQKVEFETSENEKGKIAINVRVTEDISKPASV
jgi:CspA family cold shock protein